MSLPSLMPAQGLGRTQIEQAERQQPAPETNADHAQQQLPQLPPKSTARTQIAAPVQPLQTPSSLIAEHLKSPDDLTKIAALRKKLTKEQASLSAKLKAGAKDQLEATRDGLLKLQLTRRDVDSIREAFADVEALCSGSTGSTSSVEEANPRSRIAKGAGKSFRTISEVSRVHRNFVQSATILEKLLLLPRRLEYLARMLDASRADLFSSAPNLLPLHFHISSLEAFRNETIQMARSCSSDLRVSLGEYFTPLDGLVQEFEAYLFALCERVMDLVREGQSSVVVKVVKIVERESREDEKAAAIRLAKKANLEGAARFRSVVANARVIKLYRPKMLEAIDRSTAELFDECWKRYGAAKGPLDFLDHLEWVYKDLALVQEHISPLFPADYNIFRLYVKTYHKRLGAVLRERILATDPEASVLLTLYQFCQDYKKTMIKELGGVEAAWLEPSLLEGKEQSIIDDYLGLITRKIDEWTANLMSDEVREFVARQNPPDEDNEGLYGLSYAHIIFQMVNQQVDLAADSGQASVLARAVQHACNAMRGSQATWLRVLEGEFKKQSDAKNPDQEVVGGLVEYVIALANDLLKAADYGEVLLNRLEPIVSAKYKVQLKEAIDDAINGYLDVTKRCTQVLVDLVFFDLRPAIKELFVFPTWYVEGTTTAILETIRDYTADYSERLNPTLFDVLFADLVDRFLMAYLGALRKTTKLRNPGASERVRADLDEAIAMFASFKPEAEVRERLEVLNMVHGLLTSSSTMVFLSYWTFAKAHGPQLGFLEALMRARDDLDKADVTAVMESARRKVKQEQLADLPEGGATVVHRVEQQQAMSAAGGFLGSLTARAAAAASMGATAAAGEGGGGGGASAAAAGSGGRKWGDLAQNYLGGAAWR